MSHFFLTHHFGTEQISGSSATVGKVISGVIWFSTLFAVHIETKLNVTLISLQWDSCSKRYTVRPNRDKEQYHFNFIISVNTFVTISNQPTVNTLQNGIFSYKGIEILKPSPLKVSVNDFP